MLCAGLNVSGVEMPLMANPAPLTLAAEIVTLVPPVLVTVSDKLELLPMVTLPKLRLVGFDVKVPGVTPVPDNGIDSEGLEPLEVMVTVPLALPAPAGV